ncbi:g9745 [Coccomyxa elongata]
MSQADESQPDHHSQETHLPQQSASSLGVPVQNSTSAPASQPVPSPSLRPLSRYTAAGFVGFWASIWHAIAPTYGSADGDPREGFHRPSTEELLGRQPGRDGSTCLTCVWDASDGVAVCPEDPAAAEAVNIFLAEELARSCRYNKSHAAFTADLLAFKNNPHVSAEIKEGLKGLDTYEKVLRKLEYVGGMKTYVYDVCPGTKKNPCNVIYRGEHRTCHHCPRPGCNQARYNKHKKGRKLLYYLPISDWLKAAWADADISRGMAWYAERPQNDNMFRDHFDGTTWKENFCVDPIIAANGGPGNCVGLEFCADGVNPFKRKPYSMWFGALSIRNLPPQARHSIDSMHVCFIVPGPKKPSDFSPYLDIITDELDLLYWEGFEAKKAGFEEMASNTTKTIYPGSWTWLPGHNTVLRKKCCHLNGSLPADTNHPEYRTNAFLREAAILGDADLARGISTKDENHSVKQTGVQGSHPFYKLAYWDEQKMRGPDLMHTVYGEVKGCFQMLSGVAYSAPANSADIVREYEAKLNKRYSQPQASGARNKKGAKQKLPFVLSTEQQVAVSDTLSNITEKGHVPSGWSTVNLQHCFRNPGWLKAHDWLLLAGPIGKYALQGLLPPRQEAVLFAYLDALTKLTAKEFSVAAAASLKEEVIECLANMELEFPAWELDINRHMILHLAESIPAQGPPWASAMWSYERLWNRMCQWKAQNNHPEAVMAG